MRLSIEVQEVGMSSCIQPAISVIIPVWNSERYLCKCLDSVLSQSISSIEIIIIDDNSSDTSGSLADAYAACDDRISVIHQKSRTGAGTARNRGMAAARGEYIAFMDSDDLYPSPYILALLYNKATEQKADICGGSLYKINEAGGILKNTVLEQTFPKEGWYHYRDYQYDGGFYRFLYKRSFIERHHLVFPSYMRFQDVVFFVKTMTAAQKFYAIPTFSYAYRKNHKQTQWNYKNICDHLEGLKELAEFSLRHNLYRIHYLMAKNLLETVHFKIKFHQKILFIKMIIEIVNTINWNIVMQYTYNSTRVSKRKILYRFLF